MVLVFTLTSLFGAAESSAEALLRLEEVLRFQSDERSTPLDSLTPAILVSAKPFFESSQRTYPSEVLSLLSRVLGADSVRMCDACEVPRTFVAEGELQQGTGPVGLEEIRALDARMRGDRQPAKTAFWIDETAQGVSYRVVDLSDGHIVSAGNVDPQLEERIRTVDNFNLTLEVERRARGESLTHGLADFVLYPRQHISLEWVDQWGESNRNLSGFVLSLFDPVFGVGGSYHRVFPEIANVSVGAKAILSVPTALVESLADDTGDVVDPTLTGVLIARWPIANSNYGLTLSASTNGNIGIGISLLNSSLLPFFL